MHYTHFRRPFARPGNISHPPSLIRMSGIAAYGMHLSPNVIALPAKFHIAATRTKALHRFPELTYSLGADEEHNNPFIIQHDLEVVDYTLTGTHSVASDNGGRPTSLRQTVDHSQVSIDRKQGCEMPVAYVRWASPSAPLHP